MSVVNQMLRDLDRRQAGEESAIYTQHLRPIDARSRKPLLLIGAAFLIAAGGTYAGLQYFNGAARVVQPQPIAKIAVDASAATATAEAAKRVEPEAVATPPDTTTPQTSFVEIDESEAHVTVAAAAPLPAATSREGIDPESTKASALPAQASTVAAAKTNTAPRSPTPAPAQTAPTRIVSGDRPAADSAATKIDVRPHTQAAVTAESEFRRAAALINQARSEEARAALKAALELDARHEGARQTLAVLLIEARAMNEAETLLTEGLKLSPNQSNFAVVLARLKLDHGDATGALQVLREHGAAAVNNAEYRAFAGALLQRMNRHPEALDEYRAALTVSPNVGVWWVGLGLSFEATGEPGKAAEALMRARATGTLSADVAQFVEHKLQTLH